MVAERVDYLVIGGGMAGLTVARFLRSGSVVVIEPKPGRYKLGESIIPDHFAHPALEPVRRAARRLASFSPKAGSMYVGPDGVAAFPLCRIGESQAMHVRREELEQLMRRMWNSPLRVETVRRVDAEAGDVETTAGRYKVRRAIIDCSGPAAVIPRALGHTHEVWQSFSSWCYFDIREVRDDRFFPWLRETGRRYLRLDPGFGQPLGDREDPWWAPSSATTVAKVADGMFGWQIPLYGKKLLSFGVTSRHGPVTREALHALARDHIVPTWDVVPRALDGAHAYDKFHVYNHFSRRSDVVAGPGWLAVGDATSFGEPIYASGTAVATNQAIAAAALLDEGPLTPERRARWQETCDRIAAISMQARRYFFTADPGAPPALRGLTGTPFQITMAENYARILRGVHGLAPEGDREFGSRFDVDPALHDETTRRLAEAVVVPGWRVTSAFPVRGAVQSSWERPGVTPITTRVGPPLGDGRTFATVDGLALTYLSLRGRPYPMTSESFELLGALAASLSARKSTWTSLAHPPPARTAPGPRSLDMPHVPATRFPGIAGLFAFRPETGSPLSALADAVLRGPSPLSTADRELIAAFVSSRNGCAFCTRSHAATARVLRGAEAGTVDAVLAEFTTAPVGPKLRALLAIADAVRASVALVPQELVDAARAEGATDVEIHDASLVAAAFCMYNRYVEGLGALTPPAGPGYDGSAKLIAEHGYVGIARLRAEGAVPAAPPAP